MQRRRAKSRFPFTALALVGIVSAAQAVVAPEPPAKGSKPAMLDARVNLKTSYASALAARPGLASNAVASANLEAAAIGGAIAALRQTMPGLEATMSAYTVGPEVLANRRGALTDAAPGRTSESIVRDFLARHGDVFGLTAADQADLVAIGDSPGGASGLRMLRMEQKIDGRAVFQSETRFLLDRAGRLTKILGRLVPNARSRAGQVEKASTIDAIGAFVRLASLDGKSVDRSTLTASRRDGDLLRFESSDDSYFLGELTAREIYFPLSPGVLVPAWSLVASTSGREDWYAVADAKTGDILWRKNIRNYASAQDARFRVYVQADGVTPADSPAPQSPNTVVPGSGTQFPEIAPTIVSMHTAMDPTASPNGWIDDCPGGGCTANETQTLGNNALVCLDRDGAGNNVCDTSANSVVDGNGRPTGNPDANGRNRDFLGTTPRDFQTNFLPPPQAGNPEAGQTATGNGVPQTVFRRGAMTHLFYLTNWYHDKLFALGFDEAAGNFQVTNFSGMGLGGDRVLGDAQDGNSVNNANFQTPPDGTSGRMQMFRFTGPTIDRDGGLDAEVVLHELTHGTSNRLVGNAAGLNWDPAGGMGEGWSDFVALSLLNSTNADAATARYASGAYATYKLIAGYLDNYVFGIRRFPYTSDNSINPMTWADVDDLTNSLAGGTLSPGSPITFNQNGGAEVHNTGEVWALTLWDVRSRIIADPAGANGDVPTGNHTALQLVIDGLKATPIDPSFVEARDAILDADCTTNACANEVSIWGGFADRGLGWGARAPYKFGFNFVASHLGIHESFSPPFLDIADESTDIAVDDSASNNNGDIDPGEVVRLTITLSNPWRGAAHAAAGGTATLTTSTPGVTIFDDTAAYGAIAPQGNAAGDTFLFTVDSTVACGSAIDFTVATTSNVGSGSHSFRLRVGNRNGTDPVVTYTGDPNPDIPVPDITGRGVQHQITITDDFEIADLDFRVDGITHAFAGDIAAALRAPAPTDLGFDFISLIDGLNDFGGANITNMVADDEQPFDTAHDMVQQVDTAAPYTGSWLPVASAPWAPLVFNTGPDPVGLSMFDGVSTAGTWTARVADEVQFDSGTFNAWSMLVTPRHFDCVAFAPSASVTAAKTVSGTFTVGGTVTYTVVLTNSGTDSQGDFAGHEFTDTLPASLTLVGAVATSGSATTAGNTVNWDGGLAPLGGSVTITITATINAGAQNSTISNQGTTSFDSDNDDANDASNPTDDPGVGGAADPTVFTVGGATVSATKTVTGSFVVGGAVTYTVVISNTGVSASPDNPGNELTDVLPAEVSLVSASATSGTAVATLGTNTVDWNGSIPAAGSVTITIDATIDADAGGLTVSNQGTVSYDADLNGTNESTGPTDDPAVGGAADPTDFDVAVVAPTLEEIPTLSEIGLAVLGFLLLLAAWSQMRRRRA